MKEELLLSVDEAKVVILKHCSPETTARDVVYTEIEQDLAQAQLNKIPHLDRWLELLEQSRDECPTCKGKGWSRSKHPTLATLRHERITCTACDGSGKGEPHPERIVVLDADQSLPDNPIHRDRRLEMKECNHCGRCCLSGIPCIFGQILFDITDDNPMACPACECDGELYWCGLIKNPAKWFLPLVGNIIWKCEAMADIASLYIGIGDGCGMNPSKREIISNMKDANWKKVKE